MAKPKNSTHYAPADAPATSDPMEVDETQDTTGDDTPDVVVDDSLVGPDGKSVVPTKTMTTSTSIGYGKKLEKPLTYSWTKKLWKNWEQVIEHGETYTPKELTAIKIAKDNANARSEAYNAALVAAGIEKPNAANDPQFALKEMYNTIIARKNADGTQKFTHEQARARAAAATGDEWAD